MIALYSMVSFEDIGQKDLDCENIFPLSLATANNHFDIVKSLWSRIPQDGNIVDQKRDFDGQ